MKLRILKTYAAASVLTGAAQAQFGETIIDADDLGATALFATDIAIKDDRAVVGANGAGGFEGRARVYEWDASLKVWTLIQTLDDPTPSAGDGYGVSCAFHNGTIAIGAPEASAGGFGSAGKVVIHRLIPVLGGIYGSDGPLEASDSEAGAMFGSAVACRDDWVLVGAPEKSFSSVFDVSGAVYAFRRNATTPLWNTTETAKIRPAIGPIGERFGESLDMSLNRAIIGAPRGGAFAGSTGNAYIYEETGGVWNPIDSLDPGEAAGGFGKSVSIWGSYAVVGSPLDESDTSGLSNVGAAFVFERSGSTWNLVAKLVAPEEQTNLQFGHDVSIDDRRITVGTLSNTSERAYVFSRRDLGSGGEWFLSARLHASDGMTGDDYGRVVAMDGDHIAVGARLADPSAGSTNGGKAYFYRYPSAFASFCFADQGDCPCAGDPDAGCRNSTGSGALLRATGSGSVASNDLRLHGSELPPGALTLAMAGTDASRFVLRDGLLCIGGSLTRLGARTADASGRVTFGAAVTLGVTMPSALDLMYYQVWYRDSTLTGCGLGSNLTNGVRVRFEP